MISQEGGVSPTPVIGDLRISFMIHCFLVYLFNSQMLTEVFDLSQTTFLMPSAEIRRSCRELVMHDDDLGAAVSGLVTIILLYTVILSIV